MTLMHRSQRSLDLEGEPTGTGTSGLPDLTPTGRCDLAREGRVWTVLRALAVLAGEIGNLKASAEGWRRLGQSVETHAHERGRRCGSQS